MVVFILKSSACLAIFLMFYKSLLEKQPMHTFKRFYLLAALVISLIIPSITFIEYVEVAPSPISTAIIPSDARFTETAVTAQDDTAAPKVNSVGINYWPMVLWMVYGFGALLFSIKFLMNLWKIARIIRNNPRLKIGSIINVLLSDAIVPHTFLNYIFLHRAKFESQEIPKDVLIHEATHARQRHSLDILFVELLQIIFWFNPLFHFAKQTIKLNHEFLADAAVLKQGTATADYQNILLAFASSANYNDRKPSLANSINYSAYSSIKKRFTVMKTKTSRMSVLSRTLLVLPILVIMLYGFTETKVVPKKETNTSNTIYNDQLPKSNNLKQEDLGAEKVSNRSVEIAGLVLDSESLQPLAKVKMYGSKGNVLSVTDDKGYFRVLFDTLNAGEIRFEFSLQKNDYLPVVQKEHWGNLSGKIKSAFYFGLKKKNSESLEFSELVTNPSDLDYQAIRTASYPVMARMEFEKKVANLKKGNQFVYFEIENGYYIVNSKSLIQIQSKDDLISIDDHRMVKAYEINSLVERKDVTGMTPLANHSAQYAIYTIPVDNTVRPIIKATPEQISEYNTLSKKYNAIPKEKRIIPLRKIKMLKSIYGKMTDEQKADAEPFPECSDIKAPDQEGATKNQIEEYNRLAKTYNKMLAGKGNIRIKKSDVDRLAYLHGLMADNQRDEAEPFPDFPEPPAPPTPPSSPNSSDVSHLSDEEYAAYRIDNIIENQDPNDGNMILNPRSGKLENIIDIKHFYVSTPPSPPSPKTPLDFIKEMTEKNASFYFQGDKISSEKAIEVMKKYHNINIDAKGKDGQNPKVRLSTEPIEIEQ